MPTPNDKPGQIRLEGNNADRPKFQRAPKIAVRGAKKRGRKKRRR